MFDEDCLPEHHPLQQYLAELDLTELPVKRQLSKSRISVFRDLKLLTSLLHFIYPYLFYLSERVRSTILVALMAYPGLLQNCELSHDFYTVHEERLQKSRNSFVVLCGVLLFVPVGLMQSYSKALWILSIVVSSLCILSVITALWLLIIKQMISYIVHNVFTAQSSVRSCIIFIQDLHVHSTFGVMATCAIQYCPGLRIQTWRYLQLYTEELVELCINLKGHGLSGEFFCGFSLSNLAELRERLSCADSNQSATLSECKMLREIAVALDSELLSQISGLICCLQIQAIWDWLRLGLLLKRWVSCISSFKDCIWQMDRLRVALERGRFDKDQSPRMGEVCLKPSGNASDCQLPHRRKVRSLWMHLLAAVAKTQEMHVLLRESSTPSTELSSTLLCDLRLQLDACSNLCTDLEQSLASNAAVEATPAAPSDDFNSGTSLCYSLMHACSDSNPAEDLDPEDDVLEDVATGIEDGDGERNGRDLTGGETDVLAPMPLPSSLLSELHLAIAHRHLRMQERERLVLEKRSRLTVTSQLESPSLSGERVNCTYKPLPSSQNPVEAVSSTSVTNEPAPQHTVREDVSRAFDQQHIANDSDLDDFLPSVESRSLLTPQRITSRGERVRSGVGKRLHLFNQPCHKTHTFQSLDPSVHHTDSVLSHSDQAAYFSSPSTAKVVSDSGTAATHSPFCGSSFAAALLAQRQRVGYAQEDLFEDTGTGEN